MTEPPGMSSVLGIEAVEWLPHGADSFTVRVGGRWRRRRPTVGGQPLLVIEAGPARQRFPAMPEPPGLTGAAPGTWQLSFSVPASLVRRTGVRAWLQLGSIVVPLPVPMAQEEPAPPDEQTLGERRIRAAELAAESAARREAEAQAEVAACRSRVTELERELARETERGRARERARREAEQRAHAEQALRAEVEEQLSQLEEAPGQDELADLEARIHELESDLRRLRRTVDEAEHEARAAIAARQRAEQELAGRARGGEGGALGRELVLLRASPVIRPRSRPPALVRGDSELLAREGEVVAARHPSRAPDQILEATLSELRDELTALRAAAELEMAAREQAQERVRELERQLGGQAERTAEAYGAIQRMREHLALLRAGSAPAAAPGVPGAPEAPGAPAGPGAPGQPSETAATPGGAPVEAERLAAALLRLREAAPAVQEAPQPAGTSGTAVLPPPSTGWLGPALRALARREPERSISLLEALLSSPRAEAIDAARLLAAGPLRRRWRLAAARLRGRRERYAAVRSLVRSPAAFHDTGIEPLMTFLLAAAMIEPSWTEGEQFTITYDAEACLHVRSGSPVSANAFSPTVRPATIINCPAGHLAAVLSGARTPETEILGAQRPLEFLQAWLQRAQSG